MKPQEKTITVVATVLVLAATAFGLYFLAQLGWPVVTWLDGAIGSTALAGFVVALLSAGIVARGLSQRASGSDSRAAAKAQTYECLLALLARGGSPGSGSDVGLNTVERDLALHARKSVLDRYRALRALGPHADPSDPEANAALQRLVFEMRRDLGHRDGPFAPEGLVDLAMATEAVPPRPETWGADTRAEQAAGQEPIVNESEPPEPRKPRAGEFRIAADSL